MNHNFDLEIGQPLCRTGIIQRDKNLNNACIFPGRRVGADLVLLLNFLADAFYVTGQMDTVIDVFIC